MRTGILDRGDPIRIGRYELISRLGTGGMAEAHLALAGELPGLRTLVVVKRILPHLSSNQSFVRMFYDEARIGALLDHPNIARIIEVGCDSGGYFLVMEAVQGKSLSAFLRHAEREGSCVSHEMAAFIVAQAANGLELRARSHVRRPTDEPRSSRRLSGEPVGLFRGRHQGHRFRDRVLVWGG